MLRFSSTILAPKSSLSRPTSTTAGLHSLSLTHSLRSAPILQQSLIQIPARPYSQNKNQQGNDPHEDVRGPAFSFYNSSLHGSYSSWLASVLAMIGGMALIGTAASQMQNQTEVQAKEKKDKKDKEDEAKDDKKDKEKDKKDKKKKEKEKGKDKDKDKDKDTKKEKKAKKKEEKEREKQEKKDKNNKDKKKNVDDLEVPGDPKGLKTMALGAGATVLQVLPYYYCSSFYILPVSSYEISFYNNAIDQIE